MAVTSTPVAKVMLFPGTLEVDQGQTKQMVVLLYSSSGSMLSSAGRTLAWRSSDPAVASVSSSGLVTAASGGTATITVSVEGVVAKSLFTVIATPPPASSFRLSGTQQLSVGDEGTISAVPVDASGNPTSGYFNITWSSSNPDVATVDGVGRVKALSPGTATITATSGGVRGTTSITVTAPGPVVTSPSGIAEVKIWRPSVTMEVGDAVGVPFALLDRNGNIMKLGRRKVEYASSNPAVAEVVSGGWVRGVAPGFARITVTVDGVSGTASFSIIQP